MTFSRSLRNAAASSAFQAIVLSFVTAMTYARSLLDVARADQLIYLYRTRGIDDLWELISTTYAFNRTGPSLNDAALFRPALYTLMALERYFWGTNFVLWQATSLILHIGVVLALFFYFRLACNNISTRSHSAWPFTFAMFFALLYAGMEMVAWHHIVGYLLFCLLAVASFAAFYVVLNKSIWPAAIALTAVLALACFTYELGNLIAVAMGVALMFAARRTLGAHRQHLQMIAAVTLLLPVLYLSLSYADLVNRHIQLTLGSPHSGVALILGFVESLAFWFAEALLPEADRLHAGSRIRCSLPDVSGLMGALSLVVAALVVVFVIRLIASNWRAHRIELQRDALPGATAMLTVVAFAGTIVVGREQSGGVLQALGSNSYYDYIFVLFGLLAVFHFCIVPSLRAGNGILRGQGRTFATMMGVLTVVSCAQIIRTEGVMQTDYAGPMRRTIARIEQKRLTLGDSRPLTFSLADNCRATFDAPWLAPTLGGIRVNYDVFTALFPDEERAANTGNSISCD